LKKDKKIKVQGMEDGFYGVWFPTTILKRFSKRYFMRYDAFINENDKSKYFHEMVQISQL
jgi:hypothetical protein